MSIFSKVEQVAEKVAHSAYGFLVKLFGQTAIDKFDQDVKAIFQEDVMVIFQDAIVAAESLQMDGSPATSEQKRAAAFSQIAKDLSAKGIALADHVINLGIELVVGLIRAKTPASAPAPSPSPAPAAATA
jgi:rhamnose utilization protein RhaD (predicted bifunctional aldolase and dehydrogenase)